MSNEKAITDTDIARLKGEFDISWDKKHSKIPIVNGAPSQIPSQIPFELCRELAKSKCKVCRGKGSVVHFYGDKIGKPITKLNRRAIETVCLCVHKGYNKLNSEDKLKFYERAKERSFELEIGIVGVEK